MEDRQHVADSTLRKLDRSVLVAVLKHDLKLQRKKTCPLCFLPRRGRNKLRLLLALRGFALGTAAVAIQQAE